MAASDRARQIVDDWKHHWLQKEGEGYQARAFGIDANMKHDLARRIDEALKVLEGGLIKTPAELHRVSAGVKAWGFEGVDVRSARGKNGFNEKRDSCERKNNSNQNDN